MRCESFSPICLILDPPLHWSQAILQAVPWSSLEMTHRSNMRILVSCCGINTASFTCRPYPPACVCVYIYIWSPLWGGLLRNWWDSKCRQNCLKSLRNCASHISRASSFLSGTVIATWVVFIIVLYKMYICVGVCVHVVVMLFLVSESSASRAFMHRKHSLCFMLDQVCVKEMEACFFLFVCMGQEFQDCHSRPVGLLSVKQYVSPTIASFVWAENTCWGSVL